MPIPAVLLIVLAWACAALLMAALWAWHLRLRNAAVVDVGWAGGLAFVALLDAVLGIGDPARRGAAGLLMMAWGGRLALYLYRDRVAGHVEDARYATLRAARGARANAWFFWFFQAQGLLIALLSWPIAVAASDHHAPSSWLFLIGIALGIISIAGEALADAQLRAFKRLPTSRGRTCQVGLWRYSRHPNYFFEWLIWVAYALIAAESPGGWLAWAAPALMLYLLFRVTGIPATEAQAVKSRGEAYREYQRTTSAFVPWFPKATSPTAEQLPLQGPHA